MPDAASAAPAPSQIKPPKPHNPTRASVPAPPARTARKPPARFDADPTMARQNAPPQISAPSGAPAAAQIAALPPPATVAIPQTPPQISAEYRGALSAWLERHKIYPAAARQRGEQGSAVLRFRVGRDGRILAYQLVRSTGYAALDAAVNKMMQGRNTAAFPCEHDPARNRSVGPDPLQSERLMRRRNTFGYTPILLEDIWTRRAGNNPVPGLDRNVQQRALKKGGEAGELVTTNRFAVGMAVRTTALTTAIILFPLLRQVAAQEVDSAPRRK